MTKLLALYTFGVFAAPADDPVNDGFHQRNDRILELVNRSPGFVARSGYGDEPGTKPWGKEVYPSFYVERGDEWSPATLSLWQDLESPMAFAYFGLHGEALSHGREWMVAPEWPPYVLWWVEGRDRPDWRTAVARHLYLHEHGASAEAFDFKHPFDPGGRPATIDRKRVKTLVSATTDH